MIQSSVEWKGGIFEKVAKNENAPNDSHSFRIIIMASRKNDSLCFRTRIGAVNLYDGGRSIGTAVEKSHAARIGGHNFNPVNHQSSNLLRYLRSDEHYIDDRGRHNSMVASHILSRYFRALCRKEEASSSRVIVPT